MRSENEQPIRDQAELREQRRQSRNINQMHGKTANEQAVIAPCQCACRNLFKAEKFRFLSRARQIRLAGMWIDAVNLPAAEFAQNEGDFAAAAGQIEHASQIRFPAPDGLTQNFPDDRFVRIPILCAVLIVIAFNAVLFVLAANGDRIIVGFVI